MVPCAGLTARVLWFRWCGFRGRTRAVAVWFGIIFSSGADRMPLMNHRVFQLSHLNSSHHRAQQGKEQWNMKHCGELIKSRKCCLRNHKSNGGDDLRKHLWLTDNGFKGFSHERLALSPNTSSDLSTCSVVWPRCSCRLNFPTTSTGWRCCRIPRQGQFMWQQLGEKQLPSVSRYLQTAVMVQ